MSIIPISDKDEKDGFIGFFVCDSKEVSDYQLQTIKTNDELGFMKIIDEKNLNGVRIFCEKNGRESLKQILESKKLNFRGFLDFTSKLLEISNRCEEYLLNRECIVLEENYILFDDESNDPAFFFLPLRRGKIAISEDLRKFLQKILLKSEVDELKVEMDEYREFFEYLQRKDFELKDFGKFFDELRLRRRIRKPRVNQKNINSKNKKEDNADTGLRFKKEDNADIRLRIKKESIIDNIGNQLIVYLPFITIFLWLTFIVFSFITNQKVMEIFGGSIVFALCLHFIYKKKRASSIEEKVGFEKEVNNAITESSLEIGKINNSQKNNIDEFKIKKTKESEFNIMDTVRLEDYIIGRIRLINHDTEESELAEASDWHEINNRMYVGRNENIVDIYISNPSIGKVHCEIWKEGREFYLRDLNSANGTYINGERVIPEHNFILKSGDHLRFSTQEAVIDIL